MQSVCACTQRSSGTLCGVLYYSPIDRVELFSECYKVSTEQAGRGNNMPSELLTHKAALVSGAASGIGLAAAIRFAAEGAAVALADINGSSAADAAARLRQSGHRAIALPMDVTDSSQVRAGIDAAVGEFGRLDILFA